MSVETNSKVVETLRLTKAANVGCEKHNKLEARAPGDYVHEWTNGQIPHTTLSRLKRNKVVEAVTVEEEELLRFEERHEEVWGSEPETEEQEEVSEGEETETLSEEDTVPEIVEEDIDLGPVEEEDDEEVEEEVEQPAQPKKVVSKVPRRRTPSRRSKTT